MSTCSELNPLKLGIRAVRAGSNWLTGEMQHFADYEFVIGSRSSILFSASQIKSTKVESALKLNVNKINKRTRSNR